jgi:hypothetical protein
VGRLVEGWEREARKWEGRVIIWSKKRRLRTYGLDVLALY